MSRVTYATCDLAILRKAGLTFRIPLHRKPHRTTSLVTSKNGLLHMTVKYISRHKKRVMSEDGIFIAEIETAVLPR
jgi:hypothetical protein